MVFLYHQLDQGAVHGSSGYDHITIAEDGCDGFSGGGAGGIDRHLAAEAHSTASV